MSTDLSTSALVQLLRSYYPTGLSPEDPAYTASVEAQRRQRLLEDAQKDTSAWKAFIRHVREALPDCSLWDLTLLSHDPCYRLRVALPHQEPDEDRRDEVVCLLSLLAPVYVLYASHMLYTGPFMEQWTRYPPLPPAFEACEAQLARLVEATFNATRLPNEVLFTPVADMVPPAANLALGQARLVDLLFTGDRW
jgi:hypothetical protein